jgi:hypothetical protein
MTVSTSILAYQDCIDLMDQAIADEVGARLEVPDYDAAVNFRTRIHYARKLHRDENAKTYEAGHKMHGRSEYDVLVCRLKVLGGKTYVYLERTDKIIGEVEVLSQVAEEPYTVLEADRAKVVTITSVPPVARRV